VRPVFQGSSQAGAAKDEGVGGGKAEEKGGGSDHIEAGKGGGKQGSRAFRIANREGGELRVWGSWGRPCGCGRKCRCNVEGESW